MRIEKYPGLAQADFASILSGISHSRIGLVGDLCLDMYMLADMRLSELSREVPNYTLPVVEERTSPGGAGNVAANLAALRPASLNDSSFESTGCILPSYTMTRMSRA